MNAPTPGPWAAHDMRVVAGDGVTDAFSTVALVYSGRADARLLAAAPALYEALELAIKCLEYHERQWERNAKRTGSIESRCRAKRAREQIAALAQNSEILSSTSR